MLSSYPILNDPKNTVLESYLDASVFYNAIQGVAA